MYKEVLQFNNKKTPNFKMRKGFEDFSEEYVQVVNKYMGKKRRKKYMKRSRGQWPWWMQTNLNPPGRLPLQ